MRICADLPLRDAIRALFAVVPFTEHDLTFFPIDPDLVLCLSVIEGFGRESGDDIVVVDDVDLGVSQDTVNQFCPSAIANARFAKPDVGDSYLL